MNSLLVRSKMIELKNEYVIKTKCAAIENPK